MEINSNSIGPATFALQKAMAMPNILLALLRHSVAPAGEPLATQPPAGPRAVDPGIPPSRGNGIDVVV